MNQHQPRQKIDPSREKGTYLHQCDALKAAQIIFLTSVVYIYEDFIWIRQMRFKSSLDPRTKLVQVHS